MESSVVIPAFRPDRQLVEVVRSLHAKGFAHIVVVDDGSGPQCAPIFDEVADIAGVHLLRHAINMGKGAALRTGLNYCLCTWPEAPGAVTADADGQHHPDDIERVAQRLEREPGALVLGTRTFEGDVPLRSRVGNTATRWIVRMLIGQWINDTQTGLRGVPQSLIPGLLTIPASGYEFELDMLITAKHHSVPMVQTPIRTIYSHGNRGSHFSPVRDSMRIYMVLFRFTLLSVLTAVVDNIVFYAAYLAMGNIPLAQAAGRGCAVVINYHAARRAVFLSNERHRTVLPKYLLLVAANGFISYAMIAGLTAMLPFNVLEAKLLAEGVLFVANFAIQRDLIFTRRRSGTLAMRLSRRYTELVIQQSLREAGAVSGNCRLLDFSAADQMTAMVGSLDPGTYAVLSFRPQVLLPSEVKRLLGAGVRILRERKLWHVAPPQHIMVIQKYE